MRNYAKTLQLGGLHTAAETGERPHCL